MERKIGTVSRGIRGPIIREGDDLAQIVTDSVLQAAESGQFELHDRDVVAITESVVALSLIHILELEQAQNEARYEEAAKLQYGIIPQLEEQIRKEAEKQKEDALIQETVNEETIARIVSKWTGIEVTRLVAVSYTHLDVYKRQRCGYKAFLL